MRSDILIVQPDTEQSTVMRALLESYGHCVSEAASIDTAQAAVHDVRPDAVIIHWSNWLAANQFFESSVRTNGHSSCAAIITARDSELSDAMTALEIGYDDCVRVPINETELLARLSACLRRKQETNDDELAVGPLHLDRKEHSLRVDGKPVQLAPTE